MSGVEYAHALARTSTESTLVTPPFGVYRCVGTEWYEDERDTLDTIQAEGRAILRKTGVRSRARLWRAKPSIGTSYVERRFTETTDLSGIDFAKLLRRIGEITTGGEEVAVPIARVDWAGYHRTVLAAFFADSVELRQLAEEQIAVADIMEDAGLPRTMVKMPDHVSLANWSVLPGVPQLFQDKHRTAIRYMATRELGGSSLRSVVLSDMMVGFGYNQPYSLEKWTAAEPVFEPDQLLVDVG